MSEVDFIGPFDRYAVVVRGREVEHLEGHPLNGGRIWLSLDCRIGLEISIADAERIVPFIADCMAVAKGYTGHPDAEHEAVPRPPFPKMTELVRFRGDDDA